MGSRDNEMTEAVFTNLVEFNKQVANWEQKVVPEVFEKMLRFIALTGLKRIVERTPVDTGRARGNWQVTLNSPTDRKTEQLDQSGAGTVGKGMAILRQLPNHGIGQVIWISNNVEYIVDLEEGHSPQAKAGVMVALTIHELSSMFGL